MKDTTIQGVLARLVRAASVTSEGALSGPLGVSSQAIYDARKRSKIPDSWIRIVAEKFEVSADWLFFGRGPMRHDDATETHTQPVQAPQGAPLEQAEQLACPRCAKLEKELEATRKDLNAERTERREITQENRQLWKDNRDLSVENAVLKASSKKQADNIDYQSSNHVA